MKKTLQLLILLSLAPLAAVTYAQSAPPAPSEHGPGPGPGPGRGPGPAHGLGQPGMDAPQEGGDAHGGMDEAQMMQHMKLRQEHMLAMHDLSNKILAETDPAKKEALKNQQLELMKAHHLQMRQAHPMRRKMHKMPAE